MVRLFGIVEVVDDAGAAVRIGGLKERTVLARLAIEAGSWVSESRLIDALWPEEPPPSARRTLQKYVSRLRTTLPATVALESRSGSYRLVVDRAACDLTRVEDALHHARHEMRSGRASEAIALLSAVERSLCGAPLGELADAGWAQAATFRLEALRLSVVEERLAASLTTVDAKTVIAELQSLCEQHPLHEGFHRLRMVALYRSGRQGDALRVCEQLRRRLRDELGIDPSPGVRDTERAILEQSPALLRGDTPPRRQRPLPVGRSSFIGRDAELATVTQLLDRSRLVTLTGSGGCGKTRLAFEVARAVEARHPDGVIVIELADVDEPRLVPQSAATAAGALLHDPSMRSLASHLASRSALVLVDNCEHLIDACAELVDELLAYGPSLRVLATSREPLRVDGESIFAVPPLAVDTDGVALFGDRARSACGRDVTDVVAATEICRRLDGIPLAIELAAAQTRHLQPAEILDRLTDRFTLLTGGHRRVERHQTLQAAIDWSHDLLTDAERVMLRRLAVFRGSFTAAAATAVCAVTSAEATLRALVDRSLVVAEARSTATRYRLLETMRAFADERLAAADEVAGIRDRHRDMFLALTEAVPLAALVWTEDALGIEEDADNVRAALEWSRDQQRHDLIVRIAVRMAPFWGGSGRSADLAQWASHLMSVRDTLAGDALAAAEFVAASAAQLSGDFDGMERHSAAAIASSCDDSWVEAQAQTQQVLFWAFRDPGRARAAAQEARRLADVIGAHRVVDLATDFEDGIMFHSRDFDVATKVFASRVEHRAHISAPNWAVLHALAGDLPTAEAIDLTPAGTTVFALHTMAFAEAVLAVVAGRQADAERLVASITSDVLHHGLALADTDCVLLGSLLAINAGELEHAASLLATARAAAVHGLRWEASYMLYRHCIDIVRASLDHETTARCRAHGETRSPRQVLLELVTE